MDKGTFVSITEGQHEGKSGTIFWTGPDKFNPGETRLGLKTSSGETIWIGSGQVQVADEDAVQQQESAAPAPTTSADLPALSRGMRVRFGEQTGTIFWAGPSKFGDGLRVGVEADDGNKHWLDGSQVSPLQGEPSSAQDDLPQPSNEDDGGTLVDERDLWDNDDPGVPDEDYAPPMDDSDIPYEEEVFDGPPIDL